LKKIKKFLLIEYIGRCIIEKKKEGDVMAYRGYTSAQGEATMKYQAKLKSYNLRMQPETWTGYKKAADRLGISVRQLFLQGADEYIDNHIDKK